MAQQSKTTPRSNIWKRIFGKPFRKYLLENKYTVEPAFELGGIRYFQFANQEEVPTGRQFAALAVYNEMEMRCTREYLELNCRAVDKVLSDPKKISIGILAQLNANLKDRLGLMVIPDFIYKLASVVFFDESESPYKYDYAYNEEKIKKWKESPATLDFFLQTPLKDLIPSLQSQEGVSNIYSAVAEQVAEIHHKALTDILSDVT
jgi:hypothetical protein